KGVPSPGIDVRMRPGKRREMTERAGGNRKVPQIFVDGRHIGDCEEIQVLEADGTLDARLGIGP
ncbi:MAG: glutaredoxin 3, partial [Proteobacteria bacterium]|nr:glutaredoxin 3 [Pseudomonadota bacterium]